MSLEYLGSKAGGAERDRTADLLIANEALSQLSYSPKPCLGRNSSGEGRLSRKGGQTCQGKPGLARISKAFRGFAGRFADLQFHHMMTVIFRS